MRRGGTLTDSDHRALALWAIACAEHVLPLFEAERPQDPRLRTTLEAARGWVRGEVPMREAHQQSFRANDAGKGLPDPARFPAHFRAAVLADQSARSAICWGVFDDIV
ncbi:putative immunity protein [Clavibacter sepedonicus]|uniref:Imm-5-like domain-containing protein n=1 Tax=Clavibacter sepedonicus TaxID=31964 RepID=B0RCI5_CLASE|nr:hypothetical protein CMS0464 [Clavibacter sepedonicus]